jgi:hypothetical protein
MCQTIVQVQRTSVETYACQPIMQVSYTCLQRRDTMKYSSTLDWITFVLAWRPISSVQEFWFSHSWVVIFWALLCGGEFLVFPVGNFWASEILPHTVGCIIQLECLSFWPYQCISQISESRLSYMELCVCAADCVKFRFSSQLWSILHVQCHSNDCDISMLCILIIHNSSCFLFSGHVLHGWYQKVQVIVLLLWLTLKLLL